MKEKLQDKNIDTLLRLLLDAIVDSNIQVIYEAFKQLEKENQAQRCCGNCKNNSVMETGVTREENCGIGKLIDSSNKYCDQWKFDRLSQKDRKV
jgi:hypothetical protein